MKLRVEMLGRVKRVVIKFGSGLLTDERKRLSLPQIERLAAQVAALRTQGKQCVLVSSGAIAAGMGALGFDKRPKALPQLQAAAAVGQGKLMAVYDEIFGKLGVNVAQVLLTHDDLRSRTRHLNARNTLDTLLANAVVPVINENDTVAVEEIKFGDNDRLGALTATLIDADLLIILSHVEGLLDHEKKLVTTVPAVTHDVESLAGGTDRVTSVGGMISKLAAAKIVTRAGMPMVIASGDRANVLAEILRGDEIGTIFLPHDVKLASRKRWIAFFQHPAGVLVVDAGAKTALAENGRSLLAKGVVAVEGDFGAGDVVSIRDENQVEFARGLTKVGHAALKTAAGPVVHRDDLVIL